MASRLLLEGEVSKSTLYKRRDHPRNHYPQMHFHIIYLTSEVDTNIY